MSQWYVSYAGSQEGPMGLAEARARAREDSSGYAWREGFSDWLPMEQVEELMSAVGPVGPATPPPPGMHLARGADKIEFEVKGAEMQFVEVQLEPNAAVVAEAGAMMFKDAVIDMQAIFGDGSAAAASGGFMHKLKSAGKRMLTGESMFMTIFTNHGQEAATVAFGAPFPGNIIPVNLADAGGALICQKDCFLCAARGVGIGIFFQKRILTGLFGGEGFIMQKLEGEGMAFIHAGGTVISRELAAGEVLHVDTGCVVAFEPQVDFDIQQAGNIKTALFGGEGLFFATLRGPGRIWLQSLPFSRLAGRMLQAAPQRGGSRGEGSVLGSLGNLLDGDNKR
ncbi:MAG: TIGR00266 family protein [Desulfovibrio sp.]|nr:TIGR00266 family protein [Desulfovibrio sp.]MCA1986897.1 TIGR00266 family protein [Desulfovibrio sp.]